MRGGVFELLRLLATLELDTVCLESLLHADFEVNVPQLWRRGHYSLLVDDLYLVQVLIFDQTATVGTLPPSVLKILLPLIDVGAFRAPTAVASRFIHGRGQMSGILDVRLADGLLLSDSFDLDHGLCIYAQLGWSLSRFWLIVEDFCLVQRLDHH